MRFNNLKPTAKTALMALSILLLGAGISVAQQQVNLTAGPATLTTPDGATVPMWGYSCGAVVTGSTATCGPLNTLAPGWSPVVITVPTGQSLTINLTNNLSFTPTGSTTPNTVPTSMTIVGQLGGGLGSTAKTVPSPTHPPLSPTWPVAGGTATFTPPPQGPRVQSFSTEVAAGATTATALTWTNPRPGTYLIESGTHPSIQGPMGLYGILVVTSAPTATAGTETAAGTAYPGVPYDAEIALLLSEIDPVQNNAVNVAVNSVGFSETAVWSGQPGGCGFPGYPGTPNPNYQSCYPPAVNYSPLYYLVNGVAFNKTSASTSLFPTFPTTVVPTGTSTGSVLVRFVNAGLHMHVPSIVGSLTTPIGPNGTLKTVSGFTLIAEDGNPLPGVGRVQNEVFMAPGKTYDVMINAPAAGSTAPAFAAYDRELSLSGNAINRDAGMLAYISVNGAGLPAAGELGAAVANPDVYNSLLPCAATPCPAFVISDPSKGVIANDINVYGVKVLTPPANGTVTLNTNGTFSYVPSTAGTSATPDSFVYEANGNPAIIATVTLGAAALEGAGGITVNNTTYTSKLATYIKIPPPGVLSVDSDGMGYPLTVVPSSVTATGVTVSMDADGGFSATVSGSGTYTFTYQAQNSQGTKSASAATVTLIFPQPSNLQVSVIDGTSKAALAGQDYRWVIEEDRSFFIDPTKTANPGPSGPITPVLGVNFHTSNMTYVAQGCTGPLSCESGQTVVDPSTGSHAPTVCDLGNGACRPDTTGNGSTPVFPSQVVLDPTKRYYISVLPGDAANPFINGATQACAAYTGVNVPPNCGHGMGGAPIAAGQTSVTVAVQQDPYPPGKLSVNVFEDDFPLNGEQDAGGGVDTLAPNEPGLGGFNIVLWDDMGGSGDVTGQMTYDMFNQPLTNSLDGQIDPATGQNACPVTKLGGGITGMIVTCPKYESDGLTVSPLAGQALIANLMPGRFSVQAIPGADRIAAGEEWLQTNTLDGQKAHDSFIRIGEPSYFQEFGPAGFHVSIGFANPKIINSRLAGVCAGLTLPATCNSTVTGMVTTSRVSRTPDERLYASGSRDSYYFTQCFVSIGDPDGEDFAFAKCDAKGNFSISGLPPGNWRLTTFDQWNDQIVDGLSTPIGLGQGTTTNLGEVAVQQWQANVYTRTFIDDNKDGVSQTSEAGIPLINTAVRYRDGSLANNLATDFNGVANFNETFPLFNWYVVETDTTRYKNTGTHVVYDAGGPADGTAACGQNGTGYPPCGNSTIGKYLANTVEQISVPLELRVPGAVYCDKADCVGYSIAAPGTTAPPTSGTNYLSTGRIDPPWVGVEGWQGFSGQNNFIEFGKTPYTPGENGGIKGHVIYASTRPFDDPQMLVQTQWEPLVPHVTINLYREGTAADGVTTTLTLVDTTQTSSFDDWAQGFRSDGKPNMNCPGQSTSDLFYFSLYNQPFYLDLYNNVLHGNGATTPLPYNSQFKCYDGMHNWNQLQPAPYDGMYKFPSITAIDPNTGKITGTNCAATVCSTNPTDGTPMLPTGTYVVEVVPPAGFELVKEEDKNILIGDAYIAPATQEFGALGNIFIMPDQAQVGSAYNANNAQNSTQSFGATPNNGIVPGFVPEPTWPCIGELRIVPDYISLFPQSNQVAPFAGASRHLCDRKEVTLGDQSSSIAKFYIYTSTHIAAKFTGVITDDFTSEFDPFSPMFGEKFAPANMPIAIKDWTGYETARVYSDWWGDYDGMTYSTWEVNPPNPTGYSPTMMIYCMNDRGAGLTPDPLYNPAYSQFCYELPFMPGQTQYLDTPVVPTSAFVGAGYNNPDCAYPDATPAISEVDGDGIGPWVSAANHTLTIKALGDQTVTNYAYSGPAATAAPFNQKTTTRHYGFGSQGSVTIGGVSAPIGNWSDTQITVTVPQGVPACAIQQEAQYGGSTAQCGQLVITSGNGRQSIDTVTVTIGGKTPTVLSGGSTLQSAIDLAAPGDLIIVPAGTYNEILLMWKPVRLQGVGAASSLINANAQPAGKLDPWRREASCLFGMALNGQPLTAGNTFDPSGQYSCTAGSGPNGNWNFFTNNANNQPQVDRLPLEGVLGWDTTVNGNLAEMLQEPTLMGAYEGAGITVLSKGVDTHGAAGYYGTGTAGEAAFPTGTTVLSTANCGLNPDPFPSNFQCNPSSIDGLTISSSSQGGGGIWLHAWGHNLQIANNRISNNTGTLTGGISVGQGDSPDAYIAGTAADSDPGSCISGNGLPTNAQLPYCFNTNVNMHNNSITLNSSIGDELFSSTPAGGGGVTICTGADYYKFNYNWVCGNLSTGDGGGLVHIGYSWNGDIEHNSILFNQSTNPTVPANGGGMIVMGAPPDGFTAAGVECGNTVADLDCVPGLSDGTGPNLVINANLIMGNAADSGSGGGLRFQGVNGTEVTLFPSNPAQWNSVNVTNNIIANNVAGWDGAGISLQDALNVNIINNTIMSNDTTASSGVLFDTLGAPLASSTGANCTQNNATTSCPQPAGLVAVGNSPQLIAGLAGVGPLTCPTNHPNCASVSYPYLANDVFWQNRSYYIGVGALSSQYQQNVVSLYNAFTQTAAANQPSAEATQSNGSGTIITGGTGACTPGASYWDIGVRGDTGPSNHGSGFTLAPTYSVITDVADYSASNNSGANPTVVSQYCNGSRVPPEFTSGGFNVPPGISDATVPNPIFNLTPTATVDEGNNWINMSWGPLAMANPVNGTALGNFSPATGSPLIDYVPNTSPTFAVAPTTDFFGNPRPDPGVPNRIDVGAIEIQLTPTLTSISPASGARGYTVPVTLTGTYLTGVTAINVGGGGVTATGITVVNSTTITANFVIATTATLGAQTVTVSAGAATVTGSVTFTVVNPPAPTLNSITPVSGVKGTSVPVTLSGTNLLTTTGINVSGTGIVISGIHVVNDTTVTATFAIASSATTGARTVTVNTLGGTSGSVSFTVVPSPTLTSIAPTSGVRGSNVAVTLNGTNLTGTTAVNAGSGITVTGINVVSDSVVTANFAISTGASTSARSVTVSVGAATSNAVTFTVTATVTPTLTSISPNTGVKGTSVGVTLTGTGLTGTTAVNVNGGGITVTQITVVNSTTVTATFGISASASASARNVSVSVGPATSNSVTFTVQGPTLTSIAPNTGVRGTSVPVTLTGTNLTGATSLTVSGGGVSVAAGTFNVVNSTTINATLNITAGAAVGGHNISVTTPIGTSNTVTFTVSAGAVPTLTSIAPNTGVRGTSVPVTLTGTNFTGATGLGGLGAGVSIASGSFNVVSSSKITATFVISNGANLSSRNVTVTTPSGTSNSATFTVQGSTLTSISPTSGLHNTTVAVTLNGTNLTGATSISAGSNITATNIVVSSNGTQITANFVIANNAAHSTRDVTVNTPIGTTPANPAVTFTVN
jgi:IPT/TIG domain